MLHKALVPPRDAESTVLLPAPGPAPSASSLFEAARRWEFLLEASAARAERGRMGAARVEVERRLSEAHCSLHRVVTAQLSIRVRETMLLALMPALCVDLSAGDRGLRQPAWRRLRAAELAVRRRFEHAVARLELARRPVWQLRRFIEAGRVLLEVGFVPEPRLAALNLRIVDSGLRALVQEAGLDTGEPA